MTVRQQLRALVIEWSKTVRDLDLWTCDETRHCVEASRSLVRFLRRRGLKANHLCLVQLKRPELVLVRNCSYYTGGDCVLGDEYRPDTLCHMLVQVGRLAIDPAVRQFDPHADPFAITKARTKRLGWGRARVFRSHEAGARWIERHALDC